MLLSDEYYLTLCDPNAFYQSEAVGAVLVRAISWGYVALTISRHHGPCRQGGKGLDVFKWFRRHRDSARLEEDEVQALIRRYGVAYYEACRLEHDYWDMVALLLAGRLKVLKDEAEKRSRLDIAIRMVTF
jgi:hypothetical protein